MADYSEFPTTPTRWHENFMPEPEPTVEPTGATAAPARRRATDPVSLVAGLLFIALAVLLMSGVDVSLDWFGHGIAWILLIGAGVGLLVNELRRARRRR
ncbi:conserved protein of unknown function [Modestobacter italicus]|uniref:Uncharacterized protein n=1 Tax=Modestobacter italicus (strain DSM 44449 / CECT 9708 / BC 501) TaxID=2732864 RepID=I4F3L8_MODI5|nr:hypothetical protein [Modestobacter marinus]CCH90231.1 conserved protein of unknown function [Modestobacter marinus]